MARNPIFQDWPGVQFDSWRSFISHVTDHVESGSQFVYRGQADSAWDLRPSLLRTVGDREPVEQILSLEQQCLAEFQSQAHLYIGIEHLPTPRATPFAWWALMQHHGAPTRLLDWTKSPFVAAYFAIEKHPEREGVVFVVDSAATQANLDKIYGRPATLTDIHGDMFKPDAPEAVYFWPQPMWRSQRSVAQQGLTSASINIAGRHEGLDEVCHQHSRVRSGLEPARLWLFPATVKDEILRNLRTANITAQSLFPGLDGLGRSIGEIARIGRSLTQTITGAHIPSQTRVFPPSIDTVDARDE